MWHDVYVCMYPYVCTWVCVIWTRYVYQFHTRHPIVRLTSCHLPLLPAPPQKWPQSGVRRLRLSHRATSGSKRGTFGMRWVSCVLGVRGWVFRPSCVLGGWVFRPCLVLSNLMCCMSHPHPDQSTSTPRSCIHIPPQPTNANSPIKPSAHPNCQPQSPPRPGVCEVACDARGWPGAEGRAGGHSPRRRHARGPRGGGAVSAQRAEREDYLSPGWSLWVKTRMCFHARRVNYRRLVDLPWI